MDSSIYNERQLEEIEHHAHYRWPLASWEIGEEMLPVKYQEYLAVLDGLFPGERALAGKRALDCGCGYGIISVMLARRGAQVESFDISPNMVAISERMVRENGVADSVRVFQSAFEHLDHPDASFDLIAGTAVLHHVEVDVAADVLSRLLRPGGVAIFWEPIVASAVREAARKAYRGSLSSAHVGTSEEHPMTAEEIAGLEAKLGPAEIHRLSFAPLSLIAGKLLPIRIPRLRRAIGRVDRVIDRMAPFFRGLETNHVLVFRPGAEPRPEGGSA